MKFIFILSSFLLISVSLSGQNCTILSKANTIVPDKLCSPVTANWQVSYTGVNNAHTPVDIQYDWDDGTIETIGARSTGPGDFQATASHTYVSTGNKCNYAPKATLMVNGVLCTSSTQQQIVTVWDNDDHNGGHMHISPTVYPICVGNKANVRFQDLTQFNCVPPQERDNPNVNTRWIQWIYGTDITMTGTPVTINDHSRVFPFADRIITLNGPVTGSGVWSETINVDDDKLVGQYFQVTLRNWNYCNPYDDPNINGPPRDQVNGDHPPVVTTAIILIVAYPDATITPIDTLCANANPVTLTAHDAGGTWSGEGVSTNTFDPAIAGVGNHIIRYNITNASGCSASDEITVTVVPTPDATITEVGILCISDSLVTLKANDPGGTWSGPGVTGDVFDPATAGPGNHIITYSITDKNGCSAVDQITITVATPDATITPVDTLCENSQAITLNAHDLGGIWSGPGVSGNMFDPSVAGPGNHTITYNIVNPGCKDADTITVTVMPLPVVSISPVNTLFISDPPVVLTASPPGGIFTGPGLNINIFYPDSAGLGTHIMTYTTLPKSYGCSATDTIHIRVLMEPPDATITPVDTLCVQNKPVTLTAHDQGGTWSGEGVTNDVFYPDVAGPGDHIIRYQVTDTNGYSDSDQIIITVMPAPTVNINPVPTLLINDPPVVLIASPSGGSFEGDGLTVNTLNPFTAGVGVHVITYQTMHDRYGCIGTDTIHVNIIKPSIPIADFESDTAGCSPLSIQFVNKSTPGESYYWDFGDRTFSSEKNPSHIYLVPGNYIVKLTVSNISGESSHNGKITVFQNPTAQFHIYPTDVINNSQIVVFTNYSYYASTNLWNFGDGNVSSEESPWHKYASDGTYNVTLKVITKEGCADSMRYQSPVVVEFKTGEIKFPNAFRWNQAGPTGGYWDDTQVDDNIFRPFFKNILDYKLQIYNRWGVLIYESYDVHKGWDGYFGNGSLATQGVYVWKVTGRYADGIYFVKIGDVTFLH